MPHVPTHQLISVTDSGVAKNVTGAEVHAPLGTRGVHCFLKVKKADLVVGDTLDAKVQCSFDGGASWGDVAAFDQFTGTTPPRNIVTGHEFFGTVEIDPFDEALSAGVERQVFGPLWRCKYTIAGVSPDFSFEVWASFH